MKAIVIGGAGFIGSNIVKILSAKKYDITVFDNLSTGCKENLNDIERYKFVEEDILNKKELESALVGNDIVFHLAANIGNVKSINDPVLDSEINVIGTLNVLECCKKAHVKKIIYSSSAAIFGEPLYQPIDEKHPVEPDSPYGVSKLAGEKHCLCYHKLYEMEIVCLRYFNVYGINQRFDEYGNVIPIFANLLLNNLPITIYGDGEQTRDFVNVSDVALANVLAAEKVGLSGVFNIGSGKSTSVNLLAKSMLEITNKDRNIDYAQSRKGEVLHSLADISKARNSFSFNPSHDLYKGLEEYILWYMKALKTL